MAKAQNEKKPPGWFSRRHETNAEHLAAKAARERRAENRPKQIWTDEGWKKVERNEVLH